MGSPKVLRFIERPEVDGVNVYFANQTEASAFALPSHPKLHLHAGLEMSALLESLAKNVLCIANNSFGVHVGGYLGLVVLGIYGGHETVAEWAPVYRDSYVINHPVACSPCHIANVSDCPFALKCLTEIKLEAVYQKALEALALIQDRRTGSAPQAPLPLTEQVGAPTLKQTLLQALAKLDLAAFSLADKMLLAQALTNNHPKPAARQLFVDLSDLQKFLRCCAHQRHILYQHQFYYRIYVMLTLIPVLYLIVLTFDELQQIELVPLQYLQW